MTPAGHCHTVFTLAVGQVLAVGVRALVGVDPTVAVVAVVAFLAWMVVFRVPVRLVVEETDPQGRLSAAGVRVVRFQ